MCVVCAEASVYVINQGNSLKVISFFKKNLLKAARVVSVTNADLCYFAHLVNVRLLLLELGEGRLYGSDGRVVVGQRAHGRQPTGVVEPGNVDGRRRRGDDDRSRRRAWRARGGGR